MIHHHWEKPPYFLTTDPACVDLDFVYKYLSQSYWASKRSKRQIERSLPNSIPFSLYLNDDPIGFARVVTDQAVFGYLADVIIVPEHRGHGLGKWMVACILSHPALKGCKILLETRDAQGLYAQFGFEISECMKRQI